MRLYRRGDSGEPVRDIQDRLTALGFELDDAPGTFGDATEKAVRRFQEQRALGVDGLVGRETWNSLVDASHRFGDRQLYHRIPMMRGDDVAELQKRLSALGFEPGVVDGIFGPETMQAVLDFQHNRNMAEDGLVGPEMLRQLELLSRETDKPGRAELRARLWLDSLPHGLAGRRVFIDPFCREDLEAHLAWEAARQAADRLRRSGAIVMVSRPEDARPPERVRAAEANEGGADMILAFALPGTDLPGVYHFESAHSHSEPGRVMATAVASGLGLAVLGRTIPILRETRAPAVVVATPRLGAPVGRAVIETIDEWMRSQEPSNAR